VYKTVWYGRLKPCSVIVWVHRGECSTKEDRAALDPWAVAAFVWDKLSVVPLP